MIGCESLEPPCHYVIEESGDERERATVFRGYDMSWSSIEWAKGTEGWLRGERQQGLFCAALDATKQHPGFFGHVGAAGRQHRRR